MDARRKKLLFRAEHRGFKEMDLLMGHFARANLLEMSDADLDAFESLLEQPDQDVYAWIIRTAAVPDLFQTPLLDRLQRFDLSTILQDGKG